MRSKYICIYLRVAHMQRLIFLSKCSTMKIIFPQSEHTNNVCALATYSGTRLREPIGRGKITPFHYALDGKHIFLVLRKLINQIQSINKTYTQGREIRHSYMGKIIGIQRMFYKLNLGAKSRGTAPEDESNVACAE